MIGVLTAIGAAIGLGYLLTRPGAMNAEPGTLVTVKARDGSSHRLLFVKCNGSACRFPFVYFATTTDTGLRFQDGERLTINGNAFAWRSQTTLSKIAGVPRPPGRNAFEGGAFVPV